MTLRQRSRAAIYTGLKDLIEEEAVEDLLAEFPSTEGEEAISRDFLRAEMSDLRAEMSDLRSELRGEMSDLRSELRGEMSELRAELHHELRRQTQLMVGLLASFAGVIVAVTTLVG